MVNDEEGSDNKPFLKRVACGTAVAWKERGEGEQANADRERQHQKNDIAYAGRKAVGPLRKGTCPQRESEERGDTAYDEEDDEGRARTSLNICNDGKVERLDKKGIMTSHRATTETET